MKKDGWLVEALIAVVFTLLFLFFALFLSVKAAVAEPKIITPQPVVQKIIPSPYGYKFGKWGLYLRKFGHPNEKAYQLRQADRNFWMRRMWRSCPDDPSYV